MDIVKQQEANISVFKSHLINIRLDLLQSKLDSAEKNGHFLFQDFSDLEMIKWFLYEPKHLNAENDRNERTIKEYERELFNFINQLLENSLEIGIDIVNIKEGSLFKSLQSRHLRRYQEWLRDKSPYAISRGGYSAATLSRKTTILKSFFKFLYQKKYIYEPIHEGLKIATVRTDDRPNRDLGPLDVIRLLDKFRDIEHPIMFGIIHVLVTTGIRNEEFCKLKIKDVKQDPIQGGFYLDVVGKGNKRRQIPLKGKVLNSIETFRHARSLPTVAESDSEEPLFTTNSGNAYSPSYLSQYVQNQISTLEYKNARKNEKITPHFFRHSFAIISKINGVDIYDIMRSLGHEKIETTMIYLEKIFEKERHAIHSWDSVKFGGYI